VQVIIFNKPFNVLCQFSRHENKSVLKDFIPVTDVYPAGRLDYNSEGLLVLTDHGPLQHRISHPESKLPKTYWVQLEGEILAPALNRLRQGVTLKEGKTRPATATLMASAPPVPERNPPIRQRKHLPTSWIELTIQEGKNRQVRRMTAAVGFPTLRLIRKSVGPWDIEGLAPGDWREVGIPPELQVQMNPATRERSSPELQARTRAKHAHKPIRGRR